MCAGKPDSKNAMTLRLVFSMGAACEVRPGDIGTGPTHHENRGAHALQTGYQERNPERNLDGLVESVERTDRSTGDTASECQRRVANGKLVISRGKRRAKKKNLQVCGRHGKAGARPTLTSARVEGGGQGAPSSCWVQSTTGQRQLVDHPTEQRQSETFIDELGRNLYV